MLKAIADTHTVIWFLYDNSRLSPAADKFFNTVEAEGNQIGLSAVSIAEIVYLVEKARILHDCLIRLQQALDSLNSFLMIVSFDRAMAEVLPQIERSKVPDFPDRIIAATAMHLNVPLISKDAKIQVSGVSTIW
jgi:PIN domain nuclease of toxin-antitoxin system